jgi:hypothetical protein
LAGPNASTVEYAQESRENFASISQAVCRSLDMSATVADFAKGVLILGSVAERAA